MSLTAFYLWVGGFLPQFFVLIAICPFPERITSVNDSLTTKKTT